MIKHFQYRKVCIGRNYITKRYSDPFSLAKVADHSCMSPYHFSRVFSKTFGESPNTFMVKLRIAKAKQLLITEDLSIGEICQQVGYSSVGSFSNNFKEKVGMTPTRYRSQLRKLSSEPLSFPMQSIPMCYAHHLFGAKVDDSKDEVRNIQ